MTLEDNMKRKILTALGIVAAVVLATVGVAAAEGDIEIAGRGVRHGIVSSVSESGFTLETRRGELDLTTDENTRFRIRGVQDPDLSDITVGDHVGVAGVRMSDGTLLARLVIFIPDRADVGRLRGILTGIEPQTLEITRPDGVPVTVVVTDATRFRVPDVTAPGLDELALGDSVFARGRWNEDEQLVAGLVAVFPEGVDRVVRGRVTAVSPPDIAVLAQQGPVVITTDQDTDLRVPGVEDPSVVDISVGDTIVAGGVRHEGENHASVITVVPPRSYRAVRLGRIIDVGEGGLTLKTRRGGVIAVRVDERTRIRLPGVADARLEEVRVGYQALVAGWIDRESDSMVARILVARPASGGDLVH